MLKFQLRGGMSCDTVIGTTQTTVSFLKPTRPRVGLLFYGGLRVWFSIVILGNNLLTRVNKLPFSLQIFICFIQHSPNCRQSRTSNLHILLLSEKCPRQILREGIAIPTG